MIIEEYKEEKLGTIFPSVLLMETEAMGIGKTKPIAIGLTINYDAKIAWWQDTRKGHSISFSSCLSTKEQVIFTDLEGNEWKFVPLTLERFNSQARKYLTPIEPEPKSDAELQNYYTHTIFYP